MKLKDKELTVSGALYNADWINEKLAGKDDGKYRVAVGVVVNYSYKNKITGDYNTIEVPKPSYGVLTIKNRELVKLD